MKIIFIHPHKALLPELEAYINFFSDYGIDTEIAAPKWSGEIKAEIEWTFMGTDFVKRNRGGLLIHEYASASLPRFRGVKDFLKARFNARPDFRIFLNEYVQKRFRFKDSIPFGFRDMGIPEALIKMEPLPKRQKKYDFIYCGSVGRDRRMEEVFAAFAKPPLNNHSLLILSRDYAFYSKKYSNSPNILFQGPVKPSEVADYILDSRFCINYRPLIEPHLYQTPAKLLEYAACKTPILTTDSPWVREFCKRYGCHFYFLKEDLSNLHWDQICQFSYSYPDLSDWIWEKQIRRSGILEFLQSRYPYLNFRFL